MFCPNCGTQNESAATPCKKCGFKLSGISVPKFKGTMVMNSDQTVAEMIEEHRKRQVQGGPADKSKARASEPAPRRNPGSSAPPSSLGGPRGPVLQPPRAATRGRMGGTMLGVAPQVGGYTPPTGRGAPPEAVPPSGDRTTPVPATPVPATPSPAVPSSEPSRSETASVAEATVASPRLPDAADAGAEAGGVEQPSFEPEPSPATPKAAASPAATRPLPAVPGEPVSGPTAAAPEPEHDGGEPAPAAARAVPVTAPLPRVPDASESASEKEAERPAPAPPSKPPSPPRLRPLDIVLIVCTFGVYGLVLWARQRKSAA